MSVRSETLDSDKEEEQVKWEKRLEEYCEAREEAIETLKSSGVDLKVIRSPNCPNVLTIQSRKSNSLVPKHIKRGHAIVCPKVYLSSTNDQTQIN